MRHFFTKAIVCAGVMASALALNGMAVFAGSTNVDSFTALDAGGAIISNDDVTLTAAVAMKVSKSKLTWNGSGDDKFELTLGENTYSDCRKNFVISPLVNGTMELTFDTFSSDKDAFLVTGSGTTNDPYIQVESYTIAKNSTTSIKTAELSSGTTYTFIVRSGNPLYSNINYTTTGAATSCRVNAPTGYAGEFSLSVDEGKDIKALVANDEVTVTYSGPDYVIDSFAYRITAEDVTNGSVTLTVPNNNKHAITYTVTGTVSGIDSINGTLKIGDKTATINGTSYSVSDLAYSPTVKVEYSDSNYTVTPNTITLSGTPNANYITAVESNLSFTFSSSCSESFALTFDSASITAGDHGNGVYALEAMSKEIYGGVFSDGRIISKGYQGSNNAKTGESNSSTTTIPDSGAALYVKVATKGKLTFYMTVGSSSSAKEAIVNSYNGTTVTNLKDESGIKGELKVYTFDVNAGQTIYAFGKGTKPIFYGVSFVKDGDTVISNVSGKLSAFVNGDSVYAVATVDKDSIDGASKVSIKSANGTEIGSTNDVYSTVKFDDNNTFNAVAFGATADDYLFAYEIDNDQSVTTTGIITAINSATAVAE